jgi:hypothetical protein
VSNEFAKLSITDELYTKDVNGASVTFGPGAEVSEVKLESDFSTIQILGLPATTKSQAISDFLEGLGFKVTDSCIVVKSIGTIGCVAEVRLEDPKFADQVTRRFDDVVGKGGKHDLSIKVLHRNAASGSLANRLQLSTVSCTWYKPSRVAWLHYYSYERAEAAQDFLTKHGTILDRQIQCTLQNPPPRAHGGHGNSRSRVESQGSVIISLQIGNLNIHTSEVHFNRILVGRLKPRKVVMGPPSHNLSNVKARTNVENLLRKHGEIEGFELHSIPGSTKMKATAIFTDRIKAAEAVKSLNNTKIQALGNSKLFINHVISVKYNVLTAVYQAILPGLNQLKEEIWQTSHIHLKYYPSATPQKPFTTLRLFGEELKRVAEVKRILEKILAGVTMMDGDAPLWDSYFSTPPSLLFLNEICAGKEMYIYRDARRSHLIMYGGDLHNRKAVQESLLAKVESLRASLHTMVLDPEHLRKALQGGWRRIRSKYGDTATLNISSQPKTIRITGSAQDLQQAWQLLIDESENEKPKELSMGTCVVCWAEGEEVDEPFTPSCGHTYCKQCFVHQCSSASDGKLPVTCCYANDDKECLRIFPMAELKEVLTTSSFDELLIGSFKSHIRTHPAEFQYCPTPDCPQIYRITDDGFNIVCSACLTSICTTCKVISHDGLTCEEFEDMNSEGMKLFQKWREQNDIRPCPRCKTNIEKAYGCNHMECVQCKAHICWYPSCMRDFESSHDCYAHMSRTHGGPYGA